MEKQYLKVRRFSPRSLFCDYYMFFDVRQYLADQLFIQHGVRVWFDREYAREGSPYLAVFCHVRKKDHAEFLTALEELKKKMLLCGYTDYVEMAEKSLTAMEKSAR